MTTASSWNWVVAESLVVPVAVTVYKATKLLGRVNVTPKLPVPSATTFVLYDQLLLTLSSTKTWTASFGSQPEPVSVTVAPGPYTAASVTIALNAGASRTSATLTDADSVGAPVAVALNVDANSKGSLNDAVNEPPVATVAVASAVHALAPVSETCTLTDSPAVKPAPVRTTVSPAT